MIVSGLAAPLGGMVFERWGPRVLYAGGLALLGSGYFLASTVTALWQFYALHRPARRPRRGRDRHGAGGGADQPLVRASAQHRASVSPTPGFGCGSLLIVPLAQTLIDGRRLAHAYEVIGVVAASRPALLAGRAVADDPRPACRRSSCRASASHAGAGPGCAQRCAIARSGASCR